MNNMPTTFLSPIIVFTSMIHSPVIKTLAVAISVALFSSGSVYAANGNTKLGDNAAAVLVSGSNNTTIGENAGAASNYANENTMVGADAGLSNTSGDTNTFVGASAGKDNTLSSDNTFIGALAGYLNTAGDNTFVGARAGYTNVTGGDNTFVGEEAGKENTSGSNNTFIGEDSGRGNTTGIGHTFIGSEAGKSNNDLTGNYNTAVGEQSGFDLKGIASRNTFLGSAAGNDVGTGMANTMLGSSAGLNTEHAHFNTFVGILAGYDNNRTNRTDNANRNTAMGALAGYNNREGEDNVWIGAFSSSSDTSYSYDPTLVPDMGEANNTFWSPLNANVPTGNTAVFRTTVLGAFAAANDNDSTSIGYGAVTDNTFSLAIGSAASAKGNQDIALGAGAISTHHEAISIGYGTTSHASNTVVLGNNNTVSWDANADGVTSLGMPSYRFSNIHAQSASITSATDSAVNINLWADAGTDDNDKWALSAADGGDFTISSFASGSDANIFTISNNGNATLSGNLTVNSDRRLKKDIKAIDSALNLISKIEGVTYHWKPELNRETRKQYGFIAQNVETIIPELISIGKDDIKSVNYQALIPVLVSAVNEQQKQIEQQQKQIDQLIKSLAEK